MKQQYDFSKGKRGRVPLLKRNSEARRVSPFD